MMRSMPFKGVVFIFYNYAASIGRLAARPFRASLNLVRRLRRASSYQTQPYAFIFISFFIAQVVPRYLARITNHYSDPFPGTSTPTALQEAYSTAVGVFDAKSMLAVVIACPLISIALDGLASACVVFLLNKRRSRRILKPALLYLAGFQKDQDTFEATAVGMAGGKLLPPAVSLMKRKE
jgi:hypothetical protein